MQRFGKGLCLRVCLTWLVLFVWVVACAAPPPALKQPSPLPVPVGAPIWLEPNQPVSGPVVGKPVRPAPRPIQASNQGFRIKGSDSQPNQQCFYINGYSISGSVAVTVLLNYKSFRRDVTLSEASFVPYSSTNLDSGLTLGGFFMREISGASYASSLSLGNLDLADPYLEPGRTYNLSIPSGAYFTMNDSHHFLAGTEGSAQIEVSPDSAKISLSGTSKKGSNYLGDPFYEGAANFSGSFTFSGLTRTCVPALTLASSNDRINLSSSDSALNQSILTVTPENKTKVWTLRISGPGYSRTVTGSGDRDRGDNDNILLGGDIPTGSYTVAVWYSDLPSYKAQLNIDVIREDSLELRLSESRLVSNGTPASASAEVTPSNKTRPWKLSLEKAESTEGCSLNQSQQELGTFTGDQSVAISAAQLPDGEYTLTARYTEPPDSATRADFSVHSQFKLTASSTVLPYGGSVSFDVVAPSCPEWRLVVDGDSCQLVSGSGNRSGILWDGTCNGSRVGSFPHTVQLKSGSKTDSAPVQVYGLGEATPTPSVTPTPEPTSEPTGEPTGEPTDEPTDEPCPAGQICPTPRPTATQCPVGQVCPTPTPIITPTPRPTVTPTPRPTPSAGCHGYDNGGGEKNGLDDCEEEKTLSVEPLLGEFNDDRDDPSDNPFPDEGEDMLLALSKYSDFQMVSLGHKIKDDFSLAAANEQVINRNDTFEVGTRKRAIIGASITPDFKLEPGEVVDVHVRLYVQPIGIPSLNRPVAYSDLKTYTISASKPKIKPYFAWFGRDMGVASLYAPVSTKYWPQKLRSGTMISGPYLTNTGEYEIKTFVTSSSARAIDRTYIRFKVAKSKPRYSDKVPKTLSPDIENHILERHHPAFLNTLQSQEFPKRFKDLFEQMNYIKIKFEIDKAVAQNIHIRRAVYKRYGNELHDLINKPSIKFTNDNGFISEIYRPDNTVKSKKGTCVHPTMDPLDLMLEVKSVANLEAYDTIVNNNKQNILAISGSRSYLYEVLSDGPGQPGEIRSAYPVEAARNAHAYRGPELLHYYLNLMDSNYGLSRDPHKPADLDFLLTKFNPQINNLNSLSKLP